MSSRNLKFVDTLKKVDNLEIIEGASDLKDFQKIFIIILQFFKKNSRGVLI